MVNKFYKSKNWLLKKEEIKTRDKGMCQRCLIKFERITIMKRAAAILRELRCPFVINQNSYSILNRTVERNGLLAAAAEEGKGVIIFSPLSQGLLTDRYLNGIPADSRIRTDGRFLKEGTITPELLARLRGLAEIAAARGQSLAAMALAWVYRRPEVSSVLVGASRPEQIRENLRLLENTAFSAQELAAIDALVL